MVFKPDAVIIDPPQQHKKSVIWLHGLGADGHDFEPIVPELQLPDELGVSFIFPNAPFRPVTINGGMNMRAWYDVRSPNLREQEDEASILVSTALVNDYIQHEIDSGLQSTDIILAGFSQGGAITLHCGLRFLQPLAGLIALSTYLPFPEQLNKVNSINQTTPILMAHGVADPVIPLEQGRDSKNTLEQQGYQVEWYEYMMQHAVCPQEIDIIGEWIKSRFN